MLRAAPKKCFGFCSAVRFDAAREDLSGVRSDRVVRAREARDRVEQDHDVVARFDEPLRLLDHHVGDLHVAVGAGSSNVELMTSARLHLLLHVGDFFRAARR